MAGFLADIFFGETGDSDAYVLDGWLAAESGHRWSAGAESRLRLPVADPGDRDVLILDVKPWCDAANLPAQTVMIAVNGRLIATLQMNDHRVFALRLPNGIAEAEETILSFSHLNCGTARPALGLDRIGRPLGLMVASVRVFRLDDPPGAAVTRPALPGGLSDGSLQAQATALTATTPEDLVTRFESLGLDCEFGTVQRNFGREPLGLLRFAGVVTHKLVDGLMTTFEGLGAPNTTRIFLTEEPRREFKVHEERYYLWYSTAQAPEHTTSDAVLAEQCRRLAFLRRKFLEDLQNGEKIFVLTRAEVMTQTEALAVFCALQVQGPNTLLWTVHGDASRTGQVDRILPGFLCGHLGEVDGRNYATMDAWLSVLANAHSLQSAHPTAAVRLHNC